MSPFKPEKMGITECHLWTEDRVAYNIVIGFHSILFRIQEFGFIAPWGRVLLAIVYMKPETQVIGDCDGCMIEDCDDCNFEYIEREAERQAALKRMKKKQERHVDLRFRRPKGFYQKEGRC